MIVQLSLDEQNQIERWGREMAEHKKKVGVVLNPVNKGKTIPELCALGLAGEYVVSKYLGIDYKFELFDVRDLGDLTINYFKVEVKTIQRGYTLRIPQWQINKQVDYYILVKQIGSGIYDIIGWIGKDRFRSEAVNTVFAGYEENPMWVVAGSGLNRISVFMGCLGT